ncbi:MAG: hypothetical protein LBF08_04535 [Dysgonamonadaceae bacterium]|jgi:hypothetical protein|nr:hypothetical protein [Dysgonamonadaceae bacterium]
MSRKTLNKTIVNSFNDEFEWRCMSLLIESCVCAKFNYNINIDCEEEYISAVLLDYIDKCPQAAEWQIDIAPEYRIYKDEILKRKKSAKSAPRIDFRFSRWTESAKLSYFVEAKNLIETDTPKEEKKGKKGNTITISADNLHKRYIRTGIDNYLSEKYPANGCLVGYILQGKTENIINRLNRCLYDFNRSAEILQKQSFNLKDFDECYTSTHGDVSIEHLMFNFTFN